MKLMQKIKKIYAKYPLWIELPRILQFMHIHYSITSNWFFVCPWCIDYRSRISLRVKYLRKTCKYFCKVITMYEIFDFWIPYPQLISIKCRHSRKTKKMYRNNLTLQYYADRYSLLAQCIIARLCKRYA